MVDLELLRISLDFRSFSSPAADFLDTEDDRFDTSFFFLSAFLSAGLPGALPFDLRWSSFLALPLSILFLLALLDALTFYSAVLRLSATLALLLSLPAVFLFCFAFALILSLTEAPALSFPPLAPLAAPFFAEPDLPRDFLSPAFLSAFFFLSFLGFLPT